MPHTSHATGPLPSRGGVGAFPIPFPSVLGHLCPVNSKFQGEFAMPHLSLWCTQDCLNFSSPKLPAMAPGAVWVQWHCWEVAMTPAQTRVQV